MTQDARTAWAYKNKKNLAREIIRKGGFKTSDKPSAIFMAGLPGTGKTEFTKGLLVDVEKKPIRIDMDEIAELIEGYSPSKANLFRGGATVILEKLYDVVLKQKLDFVLDGTFAHAKAINNIERALESGYIVKLYYIYQEPIIAWNFTQSREIVEHRAIGKENFIESYFKLWKNLEILQKEHKHVTISVIVKNELNEEGKRFEDVDNIFKCIPDKLEESKLENDII